MQGTESSLGQPELSCSQLGQEREAKYMCLCLTVPRAKALLSAGSKTPKSPSVPGLKRLDKLSGAGNLPVKLESPNRNERGPKLRSGFHRMLLPLSSGLVSANLQLFFQREIHYLASLRGSPGSSPTSRRAGCCHRKNKWPQCSLASGCLQPWLHPRPGPRLSRCVSQLPSQTHWLSWDLPLGQDPQPNHSSSLHQHPQTA